MFIITHDISADRDYVNDNWPLLTTLLVSFTEGKMS